MTDTEQSYAPLDAASGKPIQLSMQRLNLSGRVLPVGARLLVRHDFVSSEPKLLEVVYCFALPRDAALRRFRVAGRGFSAHSSLKPVGEAVDEYERGLEQGHLGVLARQHRDGIINLSVGNLRPGDAVSVWLEVLAGVDLRDDGLRFRFPFTLAPSYHPKARAAQVAPGAGEIELPEEEFGDVLLPQWRVEEKGLHEVAFDLLVDWGGPIAELSSPSHAVRLRNQDNGSARVSLAPEVEVPNRDLVLDVRAGRSEPRVLAGEGKDGRKHFAAVVPSTSFGPAAHGRPPFVFLLDRSGSMEGAPMEQARKALAACLATLQDQDRFGIVAFDNATVSLDSTLVPATVRERQRAQRFLGQIDARGGTELVAGVHVAVGLLRQEGAGDIFLITDGQVFGTEEIIAQARATGVRIHCLGIGSASQDRFLALLARETGGVSRFVTPRERVDTEALEVFASATAPVAEGLRAGLIGLDEARFEPEPPTLVRSGVPLALFGECEPRKGGRVAIEWEPASGRRGTQLRQNSRLEIEIGDEVGIVGDTLRLLRGARLITDLQSRVEAPAPGRTRAKRSEERLERHIEEISRHYGLASRMMALVAVIERASDRPGAPPETRIVPIGMPQDVAIEGAFGGMLRKSLSLSLRLPEFETPRTFGDIAMRMISATKRVLPARQDKLVELAALLESDGGMPGTDSSDRLLKTLFGLLAFASMGHWPFSGPFRVHLERMLRFVETQLPGPLTLQQIEAARRILRVVRAEEEVDRSWLTIATRALLHRGGADWTELLNEL